MPLTVLFLAYFLALDLRGVRDLQLRRVEIAEPFDPELEVSVEHAVFLLELGDVVEVDARIDLFRRRGGARRMHQQATNAEQKRDGVEKTAAAQHRSLREKTRDESVTARSGSRVIQVGLGHFRGVPVLRSAKIDAMKRLSSLLAFVVPCLAACGHPSPTGTGGAAGGGGQPATAELELFDYRMVSGPCPPGRFCNESISVDKTGKVERNADGITRTAQLSTADKESLAAFATSDALLSALADPWPCHLPAVDIHQTLAVTVTDRAPLTKLIFGCRDEPYSSVQVWLERLRMASYIE